MRGVLYIISGPSGVGKGTILCEAFKKLQNIVYSVSCTTRAPRPGLDKEGRTYHFLSETEFTKSVEAGDFLEYALVHDHYYGTRRAEVEQALSEGKDIVLEIDVQGAAIVKQKMPEAVSIFVKPPSAQELVRRLLSRHSDNRAQQELRIKNAVKELACSDKYDYIIVNETVEQAAAQFVEIVKKHREEQS